MTDDEARELAHVLCDIAERLTEGPFTPEHEERIERRGAATKIATAQASHSGHTGGASRE